MAGIANADFSVTNVVRERGAAKIRVMDVTAEMVEAAAAELCSSYSAISAQEVADIVSRIYSIMEAERRLSFQSRR